MRKTNPIEFLTGFMMGSCICFFGQGILIIFYDLICKLAGKPSLSVAWWMMIPLPLAAGWIMGRAIASLHLEDD